MQYIRGISRPVYDVWWAKARASFSRLVCGRTIANPLIPLDRLFLHKRKDRSINTRSSSISLLFWWRETTTDTHSIGLRRKSRTTIQSPKCRLDELLCLSRAAAHRIFAVHYSWARPVIVVVIDRTDFSLRSHTRTENWSAEKRITCGRKQAFFGERASASNKHVRTDATSFVELACLFFVRKKISPWQG